MDLFLDMPADERDDDEKINGFYKVIDCLFIPINSTWREWDQSVYLSLLTSAFTNNEAGASGGALSIWRRRGLSIILLATTQPKPSAALSIFLLRSTRWRRRGSWCQKLPSKATP